MIKNQWNKDLKCFYKKNTINPKILSINNPKKKFIYLIFNELLYFDIYLFFCFSYIIILIFIFHYYINNSILAIEVILWIKEIL